MKFQSKISPPPKFSPTFSRDFLKFVQKVSAQTKIDFSSERYIPGQFRQLAQGLKRREAGAVAQLQEVEIGQASDEGQVLVRQTLQVEE
jgi:hypothetical protein